MSEASRLELATSDGHRWSLAGAHVPDAARAALFVPALGISARHYLPFAQALAGHGIATWIHEWRGHGSSNLRASRSIDWGYRELLEVDLAASLRAVRGRHPQARLAVGGHSLGGQLASVALGLHRIGDALWLVASGNPHWRAFPAPLRWGLPATYRVLSALASANGALPGRRIGFGGREARGVIADWSRTGLRGRYAGAGIGADLEQALGRVAVPVRGVLFDSDWLAPRTSLDALLRKMPRARAGTTTLDGADLGTRADHFAWMTRPDAVARTLAGGD